MHPTWWLPFARSAHCGLPGANISVCGRGNCARQLRAIGVDTAGRPLDLTTVIVGQHARITPSVVLFDGENIILGCSSGTAIERKRVAHKIRGVIPPVRS